MISDKANSKGILVRHAFENAHHARSLNAYHRNHDIEIIKVRFLACRLPYPPFLGPPRHIYAIRLRPS